MTLKAEAVEQRLLHHPPFAHHGVSPRIAVLRTASDFDRGPPGETAAGSVLARTGGYPIAVTNAYRAASALAHAIAADWRPEKRARRKRLPNPADSRSAGSGTRGPQRDEHSRRLLRDS